MPPCLAAWEGLKTMTCDLYFVYALFILCLSTLKEDSIFASTDSNEAIHRDSTKIFKWHELNFFETPPGCCAYGHCIWVIAGDDICTLFHHFIP